MRLLHHLEHQVQPLLLRLDSGHLAEARLLQGLRLLLLRRLAPALQVQGPLGRVLPAVVVPDAHLLGHLGAKGLVAAGVLQNLVDVLLLLIEPHGQASSECGTESGRLRHHGPQHVEAEVVRLQLHQQAVDGHAAVHAHALQLQARVLLHGVHDVHGREGHRLQNSAAEVLLPRVQRHAHGDCASIRTPVRSKEAAERRDKRHAAGVLHGLRQSLHLRALADDLEVVPEPLHGAPRTSNAALEGVVGRSISTELEPDGGEQSGAGEDVVQARVQEHEAAGAVRVLGLADLKTALAEEGGMLVTQRAADGHPVEDAALGVTVDLGVRLDRRQGGDGNADRGADRLVPREALQIHEHVAGGVGDVRHVDAAVLAARELVDEPAVNGAEAASTCIGSLLHLWHIVKQPPHLHRGEVRGHGETHLLAEAVLALGALAQLRHGLGRSHVQPHDSLVQRLPGLLVPGDRGFPLVRDADGRDVALRCPGLLQSLVAALHDAIVDLLRVVLRPAGLRVVLRELHLVHRLRLPALVEEDRPGGRRPLVDGEHILRHGPDYFGADSSASEFPRASAARSRWARGGGS
mmetsp:Transcript_23420/g.52059  ORF Transcript_23420/g.52059 Transcript_23420/m.52059 type:complete len:577 (+) Transcript_23420:301-2031(+)